LRKLSYEKMENAYEQEREARLQANRQKLIVSFCFPLERWAGLFGRRESGAETRRRRGVGALREALLFFSLSRATPRTTSSHSA
jgi:hypothetical protein